jgi:hypothetical protein
MDKLYALSGSQRSLHLEQALWHMERILSISSSLGKNSSLDIDRQLNLLNASISSSQKFIEQLYNYMLVSQNQAPADVHNLKVCHLKVFPNTNSYPAAVNHLYNANNWSRYFFIIQMKIQSMTTQNAQPPLLVKDLVSLAEGEWNGSLKERIQTIFNHTVEHGSSLLFAGIKPSEIGIPKDLKNNIQFESIPSEIVDDAIKTLSELAVSLDLGRQDIAAMQLKQAIAALKMLKASLEEWNQSTDHMDLVTWSAWSLQQLQESIENTLRAAAGLHKISVPTSHELEGISTSLGIEMGTLGHDLERLSWKPRYPVKFKDVSNKSAEIIDSMEALRQHPDIEEGFTVIKNPASNKIWDVIPREPLSTNLIRKNLLEILEKGLAFLSEVAIQVLSK